MKYSKLQLGLRGWRQWVSLICYIWIMICFSIVYFQGYGPTSYRQIHLDKLKRQSLATYPGSRGSPIDDQQQGSFSAPATDRGRFCFCYKSCVLIKTLDTIGNCQRPVFSLGGSQHMHKITTVKVWAQLVAKLRDNESRKKIPLSNQVVFFQMLVFETPTSNSEVLKSN